MHRELPERDVVLLGVGHTNAHVLLKWRMAPPPGVRLTCVSDYAEATYSGMLPGLLAGQYEPSDMRIDLVRLCQACGARLIIGETTGLDGDRRQLLLKDRPPLQYDALCIGVGSNPAIPADQSDHDVSIKPMQTFVDRLERALASLGDRADGEPIRVAIVGGGVAGAELTLCLPVWIARRYPELPFHVTLIDGDEAILAARPARTRSLVVETMGQRGVEIVLGRRVVGADHDALILEGGGRVERDLAIWATSAMGAPVASHLGLPSDQGGRLLTKPTLQSVGDENVFVVGDAGAIADQPRPGSGVFAVRQGPYLWDNLQRFLAGRRLRSYHPQKSALTLLNTGDGRAILSWKGLTVRSKACWRLKDFIDRRFVLKHQNYAPMQPGKTREVGRPDKMWCGGCGSKTPADVLRRVLESLDNPASPHVRVGLQASDDVAVIESRTTGAVALSTDFFSAFVDDPFLLGRVAALNALSDLFAKGAKPLGALAMVSIPHGTPQQQEDLLRQLLCGALAELRPLGAPLVGGHTTEGESLLVGFTVCGEPGPAAPGKGGLRPGDRLILTKPLGTGVLLAAHQAASCRAAWWHTLFDSMLASNREAGEEARRLGVSAVTDVTGFGFAGHLLEMLRASNASAEVWLDPIPVLPGAVHLSRHGVESSLAPGNRDAAAEVVFEAGVEGHPTRPLLFDPQTSGGLLIAAKPDLATELLARLGERAAWVGEVGPDDGAVSLSVSRTASG